MKKRFLHFIEVILQIPLRYSIPIAIVSLIVLMISLWDISFNVNLLIFIIGAIIYILSSFNIVMRLKIKENIECLEILKEKLTNEYQTVSLRTRDEYFVKTVVEKAPYVFKAKIENDIVYYKFETKEGEIFDNGETTDYLWFKSMIL